MEIADRISVMRKGRMLKTLDRHETNERELAQLMVGKPATGVMKPAPKTPGKPLLEAKGSRCKPARDERRSGTSP